MNDRLEERGSGSPQKRSRRETVKYVSVASVGALGAVFALLNLDEVEVNWIVGTFNTPVIVVIAVSILLGAVLGLLVGRRRSPGG